MRPTRQYFPQLDGLRAVAVLGVVASHTTVAGTAGGGRGVDVFFVVSGYLITSGLLAELDSTGGVDFRRFYVRRVRRLMPALAVMLGLVAVAFVIVRPFGWKGTLAGVPISFFYLGAWFRGWSSLNMRWLGHTWSLSVEEVFYVVWPLLLFFVCRGKERRWVIVAAFAAAVVYRNGASLLGASDRWLYSTPDMRAEQLLAGACVATLVTVGHPPARLLRWLGALGAVVAAAYLLDVSGLPDWYRQGGSTIIAIATAVVLLFLLRSSSALSSLFSSKVMVWIGVRSYGIYLWHLPLFGLLGLRGQPSALRAAARLLAILLSFVAADLSYRRLERTARVAPATS